MSKKIVVFALYSVFIFFLCGCSAKDYVKASEGELSVSLPQTTNSENSSVLTEEEQAFIGTWKLISIKSNASETLYNNSYYNFYDNGRYSLNVANENGNGKFSVNGNTLYLDNMPLNYSLNDNTLLLVTNNGYTHTLQKEDIPQ